MEAITGHGSRRRARRMLASALALLGIAATVVPAAPALADPILATELAARTYPGVQLVQVDFDATLSVPGVKLDYPALRQLRSRLIRQAASGTIPATESAVFNAFINDVVKHPTTYFDPTSSRGTINASITGTGTGWVVTPDGFVVTAAHVVDPGTDALKAGFADSAMAQLVEEAKKEFASQTEYSERQKAKLADAVARYEARYLTLDSVTSTVNVDLATTGATGKTQASHEAQVISKGEGYPGNDVALLKISGQTALPTLSLGKDSDVSAGDQLYVAGFPAASTFSSSFSTDSQAQPTITTGPVTAVKTTQSGLPVFQTQAPASPGNSGGPVLSAKGKVVGLMVATAVGDDGVALEGQEYVLAASVAEKMLKDNNVKPVESVTTKDYNAALTDFYKSRYKAALPKFKKVKAAYPSHPYVDKMIADTTQAITDGKDKTPPPKKDHTALWVLGGIAVAALLLLLIVILVVVRVARRRRKPQPSFAPALGTPGYPAAPQQPQFLAQPQPQPQPSSPWATAAEQTQVPPTSPAWQVPAPPPEQAPQSPYPYPPAPPPAP